MVISDIVRKNKKFISDKVSVLNIRPVSSADKVISALKGKKPSSLTNIRDVSGIRSMGNLHNVIANLLSDGIVEKTKCEHCNTGTVLYKLKS